MKNVLLLTLTGAVVGIVAASFVVPPMISWYASPGGLPQGAAIPAMVQIPEVIRYATSKLIEGQAIGAGAGAAAGFVMGIMRQRSRRQPKAVTSQASAN